jgi:predicted O-linked N-acetylglucosamine transferase (SPINDLY family)
MTVEDRLAEALQLHRAGDLAGAERKYRELLPVAPDHAGLLQYLGVLCMQTGRSTEGLTTLSRALDVSAPNQTLWFNYVKAALAADPGRVGLAEYVSGRTWGVPPNELRALAEQVFTQAIEAREFARARALAAEVCRDHANWSAGWLAMALCDLGEERYRAAVASLERLVAIEPSNGAAWEYFGCCLTELQEFERALDCFRKALELRPNDLAILDNASNAAVRMRAFRLAEDLARRSIAAGNSHPTPFAVLITALYGLKRLDEAIRLGKEFRKRFPDNNDLLAGLADALKESAFGIDEALEVYREALSIAPGDAYLFGRTLFVLNYHPERSAEEIFSAYREYDQRFCSRIERLPGRAPLRRERLRVGYVSADFRSHAAAWFIEPLFAHHGRSDFELFAFSGVLNEDAHSERFREFSDAWIRTAGLNDQELAERIRSAGIDILVDLSGHTDGHRLPVFARRPAPVSMSWLGFGYTTGLSSIDWFLADGIMVPPGFDPLFSEKVWRLPRPSLTYRAPDGMPDPEETAAMRGQGPVVFGSLSRAIRINARVVRAWASILEAVPDASLMINSETFLDSGVRQRYLDEFSRNGIAAERLDLGYTQGAGNLLRRIDVSLDCFPHNSGTTLFDSLYMGVPFVTLASRPSVGRIGSMIANGVGHPEWIAASEDEYVARAVDLARDLPRLKSLRGSLRGEMERSPLMDGADFTRHVEEAYRSMWNLHMQGACR